MRNPLVCNFSTGNKIFILNRIYVKTINFTIAIQIIISFENNNFFVIYYVIPQDQTKNLLPLYKTWHTILSALCESSLLFPYWEKLISKRKRKAAGDCEFCKRSQSEAGKFFYCLCCCGNKEREREKMSVCVSVRSRAPLVKWGRRWKKARAK